MMKDDTSKFDQFMVVKGDVETDAPLLIEGELRGSFKGRELIVGEPGRIVGEVKGERIVCSGHIEGNVTTGSLALKKGGCQVGTVVTGKLEVESGAVIDCVLHSGNAGKAVAQPLEITVVKDTQVDLSRYLNTFSESDRPCCIEVPWSERLELYNHVLDLLAKEKPLIKIVGDNGSGKSVFASKLLAEALEHYELLELKEKVGSVTTLLKEVAQSLGLVPSAELTGQSELLAHIRKELSRRGGAGEKVVLVIDDAETMFQATMEGVIRLLSGASGEEVVSADEYLQIVLLGKPEVKSNMVATILEYFEDETNCQLSLDPLSMKDTADYLRLGLQLASKGEDGAGMSLLPNETIKEVHLCSNGSISQINYLMDQALKKAHVLGEQYISPTLIKNLSK
ncbi:polymer-forming cytoskeletal protein [Desulforhopalus sp. 52FAK]